MKSNFLNLNLTDLTKGLVVAVLTAVITYLYKALQSGDFTSLDWKIVGTTALIAAIGYLSKNLLTNSEGQVMSPEDK